MILLDGRIDGFGKLDRIKLDLVPGLNLIFAPNEGGKSTLQRFLIGMLYGQLRSDLKQQRRPEHWVERYKPWSGAEYGGMLRCRLGGGEEIEISRTFGKEESRLDIRTATGEDIASRYDRQRSGESLFADTHLGLSKSLFESLGVIRESHVADIGNYETIRDRIANLAQSGDEDLSVRQALDMLEKKLDGIGSERATTKPYKQTQDLIATLKAELRESQDTKMRYAGWLEDRNRLAGEIADREQKLAVTQYTLLEARRRETELRVEALEELERELSGLRAEIEQAGGRSDFPVNDFEEVNQLEGALQSLTKHLAEVRADREKAEVDFESAVRERKRFESYASLTAETSEEIISEWFNTWLNLAIRRDVLRKNQDDLRLKVNAASARLTEYPVVLRTADTDWQRLAREAVEDEQTALLQGTELKEKIAQTKAELSVFRRGALRLRIFAGMLFAATAAPLVIKTVYELEPFPFSHAAGCSALLVIAAAICLIAASRKAEAAIPVKLALTGLDTQLKEVGEHGEEKRSQLDTAMADAGLKELEDFLALAGKFAMRQQKVSDLEGELAETEQLMEQMRDQFEDCYQRLKNVLEGAGLICSPANLKIQVDELRKNLRRFREADTNHDTCRERVLGLQNRDAAMTEEYAARCARMNALLQEARVASPEEFRDEGRKSRMLAGLMEKESSRTREFERLSEGQTLPQWRERRKDIGRQLELAQQSYKATEKIPATVTGRKERNTPLLPWLADISETEKKEKQLSGELSIMREEHAHAVERVRQAFAGMRPVSDIEEDLALAECNLKELETNRQALAIALKTIRELARQRQTELAPQLNAAVNQRFLRICRSYAEVRIATDFQILVRETNTGKLRAAEDLSRGAQDQLYFAIRFGILDLISKSSEPCPCLMDEPFASYDHQRLAAAFEILTEESERRQLVVFTCREDLLTLAQEKNSHILRLTCAAN